MASSIIHYKFYVLLLFTVVSTSALVACSKESAQSGPKPDKVHLVEAASVQLVNSGISRVRTGTLRARREINVYSQEEGRVTALPFYEGDKVSKGQVVARLDDELLRSQLARAEATWRKAEQDLKRMRDLYKKKLTTDEEMSRIETELEVAKADVDLLNTRLSYTVIKAPINGLISNRLTQPGNVVEKHSHLLSISDPSSLVTEVSLSELLLPHITLDDPVKVTIDALGQSIYNGAILRIHPTLNPVTRRGMIEVELKPVPNGARPGQLCRVEFTTKVAQRLVIPFGAILRDDQGEFVYVLEEPAAGDTNSKKIDSNKTGKSKADGEANKTSDSNPAKSLSENAGGKKLAKSADEDIIKVAKRRTIRSGLRIGEQVEILQGLQDQQQVVTRGFLGLNDGKQVKVVNSRTQSGEPPTNTIPTNKMPNKSSTSEMSAS